VLQRRDHGLPDHGHERDSHEDADMELPSLEMGAVWRLCFLARCFSRFCALPVFALRRFRGVGHEYGRARVPVPW
jgi:hypothetical protein